VYALRKHFTTFFRFCKEEAKSREKMALQSRFAADFKGENCAFLLIKPKEFE
jgi:hypothetical protein